MSVSEDIIYYYCKKILKKSDIYIFAGEPPGGSDELHRVELKYPGNSKKGSKGSKKIDLIGYHHDSFLLIELKDSYKKLKSDILKLNEILEDNFWIEALWNSLNERNLLGNGKIPNFTKEYFYQNKNTLFQKCLGAYPSSYIPPENFLYFEVKENYLKCRGKNVVNNNLLKDIIKRISNYN